MTHLCAPIFVSLLEQAGRDALIAAESGAYLVEFRIDRFADPAQVPGIVRRSTLPCIITCRSPDEGGVVDRSDAERIAALNAAVGANPAYIDIELKTYRNAQTPLTVEGRL